MLKSEEAIVQKNIDEFKVEYGLCLQALSHALDDAEISHYSSGGGSKSVTFNIFPASAYIAEFTNMLSLDRRHKSRSQGGFRDASAKDDYSPGQDFILYLHRWSIFAEQVMQREGASPRGVAAARAKLIINDLQGRLVPEAASQPKVLERKGAMYKNTGFFKLMQSIGTALEDRLKEEEAVKRNQAKKQFEDNYMKALAAAQGTPIDRVQNTPRAEAA